MPVSYLTDLSPGAPTLSGTNGSLCTVLDWALVQQGWAIEYTSGNARVYRPGSGNRHRLHVNHDSAVSSFAQLATVRGCENASSATALIDPFPTVAQMANASSTFCVSNTASSTARPYRIVLSPTMLIMAVSTTSSSTSNWDLFVFGDVSPSITGDTYGTIVHVGDTSGTSTPQRGMANCISPSSASGKTFWCRSIDGSIKSTYGCLSASVNSSSTSNFCSVSGAGAMRAGYMNQIVREKVGATCIGSSSTTSGALAIVRRGWIPNLWNPVHNGIGSVTSDDLFTDTAYAAGSQFSIVPASSAIAAILEHTNTWSAPSG